MDNVIDLTAGDGSDGAPHDSEDEDLKAAIALSLQDMKPDSPQHRLEDDAEASSKSHLTPSVRSEVSSQHGTGILGLDRKADEAARLERLKRKRATSEISPPPLNHQSRPNSSRTNGQLPMLKAEAMPPTERKDTLKKPLNWYPDGEIRKTWVFQHARERDIKIEEILQRNELQAAVLSSFMWDMDWLFTKVDTKRTKFVLVMQAKDAEMQQHLREQTSMMENLRLCFPPMPGQVTCMHSKLMLLFYETRLRIAVPTANLTQYDWGETGVMENLVFLIDLPMLQNTPLPVRTSFAENLLRFLDSMGLQNDVIEKVKRFDFSRTAHLGFVHSIGGSHCDDDWKRTGLCGLGVTIQELGLHTRRPLHLDFVTSSMGSLKEDFLRSLYMAAQGDGGLAAYAMRNPKTSSANHPKQSLLNTEQNGDMWKSRFKVYFPTEKTVKESKGGPNNAGTICFQKQWWMNPDFPRHVMRDCVSRRAGLLMHNKLLLVRAEEQLKLVGGSSCQAWAYLGSANLSESAWGKLIQDRKNRKPKLNLRNWECGVVFPIQDTCKGDREKQDMNNGCAAFEAALPIPIEYPGQPYGQSTPWFFLGDA